MINILFNYRKYVYWCLNIILLLLNLMLLNQSPEKRCGKKFLYLITYKYLYIYIFSILLLINVNDIKNLMNNHPLEYIPGLTWVIILLLVGLIIMRNTDYEIIEDDGSLNIPPKDIKTKSSRISYLIFTIIVFSLLLGIQNIYGEINNITASISGILYLFLLYKAMNYKTCLYNFPISWEI